MECVILNKRQQDRVEVITRFMDGKLDVCAAAQALKVSVRQFYRIVAKFRERGAASVVHGNTGSRPANRTSDEVRERLRALAGEGGTYHDFNTSHIHEVLLQEGIDIGRSTLDRILKEMGLRQVQRKKPNRSYRRRERRSAEGMMLQIDASHHDWLEGRGPKMTLVGAVDDATGKVLFLLFRPTEDQVGYLLLLKTIATTYGLPMSYYHDRHTILRYPKEASIEDELAGKEPQSQLQRIMSELGCQSIAASTPQAKGRIERLWRTLQDRLVKELRAAGVNTLEEANAYLPGFLARYNERFAKEPADGESAWVALPEQMDLDYYFAIREERTVRKDHTISWKHQDLLILRTKGENSLSGKRISVHVTATGETFLYHGKERLCYRTMPPGQRAIAKSQASAAQAKPAVPNPKARARQMSYLHSCV